MEAKSTVYEYSWSSALILDCLYAIFHQNIQWEGWGLSGLSLKTSKAKGRLRKLFRSVESFRTIFPRDFSTKTINDISFGRLWPTKIEVGEVIHDKDVSLRRATITLRLAPAYIHPISGRLNSVMIPKRSQTEKRQAKLILLLGTMYEEKRWEILGVQWEEYGEKKFFPIREIEEVFDLDSLLASL